MKTRVYQCSTLFGLSTLARVKARLERGSSEPFRSVLLVCVTSLFPEIDHPFDDELARSLFAEFDLVLSLNELIAPFHPSAFRYHGSFQFHRGLWLEKLGTDQVHELVVESIQVPPALSLVQLFSEARIRVYSDGLMVYSPTRISLPAQVLQRISVVYYVDLLDGIEPLLLREARPRYEALDVAELRAAFASGEEPSGAPVALFLAQSMSCVGMMEEAQETSIYVGLLDTLERLAPDLPVAFKPHPAGAQNVTRAVLAHFRRKKRPLELLDAREPLERLLDRRRVRLVCGVFSTGLFSARKLFDVPVLSGGTRECLALLRPTANSNRIPLVAADMLLPRLIALEEELRAPGVTLDEALERVRHNPLAPLFSRAQVAVGVAMQPQLLRKYEAEAMAIEASGAIEALSEYFGPDLDYLRPTLVSRAFIVGFRAAARPFLTGRKLAKLELSPEAFLADSQHPALQRVGEVHRALRRIGRPRH